MNESSVTLEKLKNDSEITTYLRKANEHMRNAGFTEHGLRHAELVADIAKNVMIRLDRPARDIRLAAMAGYLHDIGNFVARYNHAISGATLVWHLLRERGMEPASVAEVVGAVGNHEEEQGMIIGSVAAALVLADKSDVHRSRVNVSEPTEFDIHDRVNYAVRRSFLHVDAESQRICLQLEIDTEISPVMDYFEIFLTRMLMCRRAAEYLGQQFDLSINGMNLF